MAKSAPSLQLLKNVRLLSFIGVALLVCIAYWPGLNGPYVLDDDENILNNSSVALTELTGKNVMAALMGNDSGPLKRPIAAVSFALNHYFNAGFYPSFAFKVTNLAIHLLNAFLIYLFSLKLLETPRMAELHDDNSRQRIAVFATALWALHPIQLTSVLYVVQRMTSLSALFVVLGLIMYLHGRKNLEVSGKNARLIIATGVVGGTLLGIGAKENAVLLPILAFIIDLTLYRHDLLSASDRKWLWGFYLCTTVIPLMLFIFYLVIHPDFFFNTYAARPFSPYERLLTEARVLWFYLSLLLVPSIQRLGLFHDDIPISTGILQPLSTLTATMGIITLLGFALIKFRRYPLASFAILWYLAGHSLESSIFGLETAYEHRNYLPSYGVIFFVACAIVHLLSGMKIQKNNILITSLPYVIVLIFGFSTWAWASTWKDAYTLAEYHVAHHPNSPRAYNFAASVAIFDKNDFMRAVQHTINGIRVDPQEVGFRLDMRLYLAKLESDIHSGLDKAQVKTKNKQFHISTLPDSIEVKNINGKLKLVHSESDGNTISEMLRNMPISVYGVVALDVLTNCIINNVIACNSLRHDAIKWLDSAAENPRSTIEYRALIAFNAAKLHAYTGDTQRALTYIEDANRLVPGSAYYKLDKTNEAGAPLNHAEEPELIVRTNRKTNELLQKMQFDIAGKKN